MSIEVVGYLAGILVSISLLPQLLKSIQTKSTKDISLRWNLIYFSGLVLWVVYAWGTQTWPLFFMTSLEAFLALCLMFLKLRYG